MGAYGDRELNIVDIRVLSIVSACHSDSVFRCVATTSLQKVYQKARCSQ